jgi:dTDP-glucose pyrophosphorylase
MAGKGSRFADAGYAFPKPLIDVKGKTMIEVVVNNLRPSTPHKFIFICQREHYEKYDLYNILKNATRGNFEVIQINGVTEGAACTALLAKRFIDNDDEMMLANSDQFIEADINDFIAKARESSWDGYVMTFEASHPKWSYARVDKSGQVVEVAEKKVISSHATVGVYYYKRGADFVAGAESMIHKNIRHNNEFYACPVYNELILAGKHIGIYEISPTDMDGLGTPEDLAAFERKLSEGKVSIA